MDVKFFACSTTMGVMGIRQDELIPQAQCAGATTFLSFAADADVSLFV
jgi:peroxiredoxin family protein